MAHSGPMTDWRKARLPVIAFLAPATIIYTLFMIYPLVDSIRLRFNATPMAAKGVCWLDIIARLLTGWGRLWTRSNIYVLRPVSQRTDAAG